MYGIVVSVVKIDPKGVILEKMAETRIARVTRYYDDADTYAANASMMLEDAMADDGQPLRPTLPVAVHEGE